MQRYYRVLLVSAASARPVIGSLLGAGTPNVVITWNSFANQTYRVQCVTDLATTNWFNLAPDVTATGSSASFTDHPAVGRERYYRVVRLP